MVENRVLPNGVVSIDIFYLTILMNFKATRRFSPFSQPLHRREGGREEKSRKKKKNLSTKYKSHLPMASHPLSLSFLLLSFLISSVSSSSQPIIQLPTTTDQKSNVDDDLYCASWHLSVETNNAGSWKQIPIRCESFVQDYMTGPRYMSDSEIVANYSLAYASSVEIGRDGKDAWVFDIDETLLTNLPYYQAHGFGSEPFDENSWDVWVDLAEAPAIPASLKLYNELKQMGFKIFVLTGRSENQRNATGKNLLFAGYTDWERLILRGPSDDGTLATVYKSEKRSDLVNEGYRIHGSSGDQWSDLLGFAVAKRSFKLPNPMYYIS
ncbi:HAD superfamily isoform 1 [Theobroma cacao]|uniref:HAD superfamily isoform 1 n=2 Tax=Theobroma cacao TaxID=3641 RepID=A0A061GN76_THECC|nr:HAD superfamily isoform 1 [Theobroma cacao]